MKVLAVLSTLVAFAAAGALLPTDLELLQAFDYDTLFAKDEQTNKYIFDCLLEKGECGSYKQLAELAMKVMINQCAECSPTQKAEYDFILKQLHDKYKPFYNDLMKKVAAKRE